MLITCPSCQKSLEIADGHAGAKIHCAGCGSSVAIPAALGELANDSPREMAAAPDHVAQIDQSAPDGFWRDGQQLVMRRSARLPFVCVKTNQPADLWVTVKVCRPDAVLRWPALHLIALLVDEIDEIQVGVCAKQMRRQRRFLILILLVVIAGAIVMMVGASAGGTSRDLSVVLAAIGGVTFIAAGIFGVMFGRVVRPTRITTDLVWLAGVHPEFLAGLRPFPRNGH